MADGVDALSAREVDGLISKLLCEMQIPFPSLGKRVLNQLADLKRVLSADYREAPGLPPRALLRELALLVETQITSQAAMGKAWDKPELFSDLTTALSAEKIEVRAEPYLRGAGLALRGFFCRADLAGARKFVIFLNTAHIPAAVAATFGHELGHYIYGSLVGNKAPMIAFMEGTFAEHLLEEPELFADSLVALSAYSRDLIRKIGPMGRTTPGSSEALFARIKVAYEHIGERYKLDLRHVHLIPSRVRYLTSMIHFFKLRCALLESASL